VSQPPIVEFPKGTTFLTDVPGWSIVHEERFPKGTGPDPDYNMAFALRDGFLYAKRFDKKPEPGQHGSTVDVLDGAGKLQVQRRLDQELFRVAAHPSGTVFSDLSFQSKLTVFDREVRPLWAMDTTTLPVVQTRARGMKLGSHDPFRWIKGAMVSGDGSLALVGAMDQVWLLTPGGDPVWGLQMPFKKNWMRMEIPGGAGISEHAKSALGVLGLTLPATIEAVKAARKALLWQWHPDVAAKQEEANQKAQEINEAYRVLTGMDPDDLQETPTRTRFVDRDSYHKEEFTVEAGGHQIGISFETSLSVGEAYAADWLAYVCLSGDGCKAYAASCSGSIFEIGERGEVIRAYALNIFPYGMQEAYGKLYVNMEDYLLILADGAVLGRIPTLGKPTIFAYPDHLVLWSDSRVRWFTPDGQPLGQIAAKAPVRRVYPSPEGWVIETRQNRCVLVGPPSGLRG